MKTIEIGIIFFSFIPSETTTTKVYYHRRRPIRGFRIVEFHLPLYEQQQNRFGDGCSLRWYYRWQTNSETQIATTESRADGGSFRLSIVERSSDPSKTQQVRRITEKRDKNFTTIFYWFSNVSQVSWRKWPSIPKFFNFSSFSCCSTTVLIFYL